MKRLFFVVILTIVLIAIISARLSDSTISFGDTSVPDNEQTTSQIQASNASASATIMITMTGILDE